jgi:mRNA interferase MazF
MAGIGNVRRGDVVTIVLPKDFGKPRPAVVFQSDNFPHTENITVLPITSAIANEMELERLLVEPSDGNGLRVRCQIRIDAIQNGPPGEGGPENRNTGTRNSLAC